MNKSFSLLLKGFESSSTTTPEFLTFFKAFKSDVTKILKSKGCTNIKITKGHFYASGFFTAPSGQIFYISLSDVRGANHTTNLMYRTANSYTDYTGGHNHWVRFADLDYVNFADM